MCRAAHETAARRRMTDNSDLASLVERLRGARVLVVGDVMLDRFVYGDVLRISPEAPVPVCHVTNEAAMLGGAGNVARNLSALGASVDFVSAVGADAAGAEIRALLAALGGVGDALFEQPDRQTSIKTRFFSGTQQLLRVDRETTEAVPARLADELADAASRALERCGAVVLSDYGKGVLTDSLTATLISAARARGKPVVVDPKGDDFARYAGASMITPNRRELAAASRMPVSDAEAIVAAARHVAGQSRVDSVLVTRSADGMTLVGPDGAAHLPAEAREVFDVSGAGDTVVAALSAALASGIAPVDAARLANLAAGIVVGKVGTAVAFADDVIDAIHRRELLLPGENKVLTQERARDRITAWRGRGERIGFTNGCFDLIHPGHVALLAKSRAACDRLVVGLNSDASVRRLKGASRPVQNEAARAAVLASLASVDLVVIFGEDTPVALIEAFRPDLLAKGADYTLDQVVGADLVRSWGGEVRLIELEEGHSTTATIERLSR